MDGELAMSPINQNSQLNPARSAEIEQGIDGCSDRSACEEDIVYNENVFIFDGKMNLCRSEERRVGKECAC
jgi:hypothetical protein